jgi:hypothetical protein
MCLWIDGDATTHLIDAEAGMLTRLLLAIFRFCLRAQNVLFSAAVVIF